VTSAVCHWSGVQFERPGKARPPT